MSKELEPFFLPRGVALIGASSDPNKLGYGILSNMSQYHYAGEIYPVNPKEEEILGYKCYADIREVPQPVDLAVIIISAPLIAQTLENCGECGIKSVIIISGGFKEVGQEGTQLEAELVRIAKKYGMRFVGPNCVGTMDLNSGLNTTFIKGMPARGGIGFLSQSGAVCGAVVDYIINKGVGFSHFVSLGNEANISETDIIEYLGSNDQTRVITAYVEAIEDGQRFIKVVKKVSQKKPVVIIKAGRSDAGARAVSSHTGSLAGSYAAYKAAFTQSGALEVNTLSELFDVSTALDYQSLPAGNRVGIITNSGGPAALASDSLASRGLVLADLSDKTQTSLRAHLNPSAQVKNPVDMLGGAGADEFNRAVHALINDENVDAILTILVPQSLVDPAEVARAIGEQAQNGNKPVVACFMGDVSLYDARQEFIKFRIPMINFPEGIGPILGAMWHYAQWLSRSDKLDVQISNIDHAWAMETLSAIPKHEKKLGEASTRPVLNAYGIPIINAGVAHNPDEAVVMASEMGYPVAIKVVSSQIFHKTDAGGLALDIRNEEQLREQYAQIHRSIKQHDPSAWVDGFLVEQMAPDGLDVIVGMRRDVNFGPLMMFGMGGIFVELFKDVSFKVAPLNGYDAMQMIENTKAGDLLHGYRGAPAADIDAVVDCILRMAQLAVDFPEIEEIEINPLRVFPEGKGAVALDARMVLNEIPENSKTN